MRRKIGLFFIIMSLPLLLLYVVEAGWGMYEDGRYIGNTAIAYEEHPFEIEEQIQNMPSYVDPWGVEKGLANVTLRYDGEEIGTFHTVPVTLEAEGLARYYGTIGMQEKQGTWTVVVRNEPELFIMNDAGQLEGRVPDEERSYTVIKRGEENEEAMYAFTERTPELTAYIRAMHLYPTKLGYLTNVPYTLPSIWVPITYPFATLFIGLALYVTGRKKTEASE